MPIDQSLPPLLTHTGPLRYTGPMTAAFIAIGTNLGDRDAHIAFARERLQKLPRTKLLRLSSVRETEPVGPVQQDPFLNAVAEVDTQLDPLELLQRLKDIEHRAGRIRSVRWGPRTLDLDLLLYGDRVIQSPQLTLPHPHMHERRFVLEPLAELAPQTRHPTLNRTAAELLADLQREP